MSPIFSLFQTPRISRRASSPPVCSVSPSSSKCPGVSVPAHPVLGSSEGRDSHREGALEREKALGGEALREKGSQGEARSPSPCPAPLCHQAKVPRKGGIQALPRTQGQGNMLLSRKQTAHGGWRVLENLLPLCPFLGPPDPSRRRPQRAPPPSSLCLLFPYLPNAPAGDPLP